MSYSKRILGAVAAVALAVSVTPGISQIGQNDDEFNVIYLGASWMQRASFLFSEQAAIDLGVDVRFVQRNTSNLRFATEKLANSNQWAVVKEADILIIMIEGPVGRREGYCLDTPSDTPRSDTVDQLELELDAFLAELTRHVDPAKIMVRIGLPAVKPHFKAIWVERDLVEECAREWEARADVWREGAARYGIGLIDVRALWNGPDGTIDSPIDLYVRDKVHLTEEGAEVVAEIIRSTGYAPLDR